MAKCHGVGTTRVSEFRKVSFVLPNGRLDRTVVDLGLARRVRRGGGRRRRRRPRAGLGGGPRRRWCRGRLRQRHCRAVGRRVVWRSSARIGRIFRWRRSVGSAAAEAAATSAGAGIGGGIACSPIIWRRARLLGARDTPVRFALALSECRFQAMAEIPMQG